MLITLTLPSITIDKVDDSQHQEEFHNDKGKLEER